MVQEVMTIDCGDVIAHSCAFDKNAKTVAVGCSDGDIRMVNVEKQDFTELKAHTNSVNGVLFNQDNSTLYSVGGEGHIKVWH